MEHSTYIYKEFYTGDLKIVPKVLGVVMDNKFFYYDACCENEFTVKWDNNVTSLFHHRQDGNLIEHCNGNEKVWVLY
jgi:hypothetical protein